jgi:hypothetical protein
MQHRPSLTQQQPRSKYLRAIAEVLQVLWILGLPLSVRLPGAIFADLPYSVLTHWTWNFFFLFLFVVFGQAIFNLLASITFDSLFISRWGMGVKG